ncbi:MAG: hypothetical protein KGK03_10105, partial [Candidatus Omnitrophica bacterium]|nr:hypothetical protein [Candidatus Omnitrophota bacterium]
KLQNLTGGLQEKVAPNKKARAPYQNALLWFWANLSRFPFPLKVELILLKIRVLMGLALDSRARYLDQVFDLLINLDGVLVSSDSRGGRNRPAIIIDPKPAADGVSAMSKILYVVENNLPLFNLIVEKQKVDCKSILRIVNIEQDSNYSTLLFKLNFENSRITVLRSDEAHSFDGIMHSMKNSEGQNIDIFKIDIKNWCDYLWKDEIAAKFFLSKTKFISIRIPNMEGMRQRLYALLGDSGFDFSTKGDLTIGYNKNLLPRIF